MCAGSWHHSNSLLIITNFIIHLNLPDPPPPSAGSECCCSPPDGQFSAGSHDQVPYSAPLFGFKALNGSVLLVRAFEVAAPEISTIVPPQPRDSGDLALFKTHLLLRFLRLALFPSLVFVPLFGLCRCCCSVLQLQIDALTCCANH